MNVRVEVRGGKKVRVGGIVSNVGVCERVW